MLCMNCCHEFVSESQRTINLILRSGLNPSAPSFTPQDHQAGASTGASRGTSDRHSRELCKEFSATGNCADSNCSRIHGEICEFCSKHCLIPNDAFQQREHKNRCIEQHHREMEIAFLVQRSEEKMCGICLVDVYKKEESEQKFGILENCSHCFCFGCIMEWRTSNDRNKLRRMCPLCRQYSRFVISSSFWVENDDERRILIAKYMMDLKKKDCKYFRRGYGNCPFRRNCLLRHRLVSGQIVDDDAALRPVINVIVNYGQVVHNNQDQVNHFHAIMP